MSKKKCPVSLLSFLYFIYDCRHSRSKPFHRLYRSCMYLERLHIVTACLLGRFPSGETSQRTDVIDAELYVFLAEGRNVRFESAAHFELWHQVFPDVQDYVCIAHHHQAHDRRARSHQLAALGEDSGYLSVFGSSEPGVHKKGGNFIHRAACGIYKSSLCAPSTAI